MIRRKPITKLLVNIEHPDALGKLEEILDDSDGIVLARNWLGGFVPEKFNLNV